jgi:hypothetical protein
LSKEAKIFQRRFSAEVVPRYLNLISQLVPDALYTVSYEFYFERDDVLTKTFGEKGGAKSRYKRMDAENRVKLVADCLFKALGLDDCVVFKESVSKNIVYGGINPQVRIFLNRANPQAFGIEADLWERDTSQMTAST